MATDDIKHDSKTIFEVRNGVFLAYGERTKLGDGWWFGTNGPNFGPFATMDEALDAAELASAPDVELHILANPDPPLPVTDPGEVFPLWSGKWPRR